MRHPASMSYGGADGYTLVFNTVAAVVHPQHGIGAVYMLYSIINFKIKIIYMPFNLFGD